MRLARNLGVILGLVLVAGPAYAQNTNQETKPTPKQEQPAAAPQPRRPQQAPAPFKPAEEVSPSRKLSFPSDI